VLEIKNLSCGYDSKLILKDVNLNISAKEFVGIIGPNGSGKTTLLKTITRLLKPRTGGVFIDGKDVWQAGYKELAEKIAVVPQGFSGAAMSVEEFVLLGRIPYFDNFQFFETKKDMEIAEKCMNLTDTFKLKDRLMEEMSGGERQLTLIARALAQEPELLLLDEPTTHLDITHQVRILDIIKKLNREMDLTVIMVLHDLNLASEYCDRLVLLSGGVIYKDDSPENVLDYKIIEEVYKTMVVVKKNPISSKPYILLVSEEGKRR